MLYVYILYKCEDSDRYPTFLSYQSISTKNYVKVLYILKSLTQIELYMKFTVFRVLNFFLASQFESRGEFFVAYLANGITYR